MHRSSPTISAFAAALAKAQIELTNPEKSLSATIRSPFPGQAEQPFRYASLASGLDIIRKALGRQEIATIQTTGIDEGGRIYLTTLLAHASGEWISSEWPVCAAAETAHRMGAALTYARRYALFALVGIAGEDDLDAPDGPSPSPPIATLPKQATRGSTNRSSRLQIHPPSLLPEDASSRLRDQLLLELRALRQADELAAWAYRRLPAKNSLVVEDARIVEATYRSLLDATSDLREPSQQVPAAAAEQQDAIDAAVPPLDTTVPPPSDDAAVFLLDKPQRRRSKLHLTYVRGQPCLVCQRTPSDAHHLTFAQARALGRKVSDEYTVPLCRDHHAELHRHGNEPSWWANLQIAPLEVARSLWDASPIHRSAPAPARPTREAATAISALESSAVQP